MNNKYVNICDQIIDFKLAKNITITTVYRKIEGFKK